MVCGGTIAAILTMLGASAASAQTFFVNERGASATCAGAGINACPTIKEAVAQAEKASPPNTIEVEPETGGTIYHESIELLNPKAPASPSTPPNPAWWCAARRSRH